MNLFELIKNTDCCVYGNDCYIEEIVIDSRITRPNSLFVCLVGINSDGHNYASDAYNNGCRAYVCERKLDLPDDCVQIVFKDSREALGVISSNFYGNPSKKIKVIGITGTKGKTTTAWLVYSILNKNGIKCGYIGSNGISYNGIKLLTSNTTPESIYLHKYLKLMLDSGVEYVALEVSSQALAHYRVDSIDFYITSFTNLYEDHIGFGEHKDFDDYKSSKKKLFSRFNPQYVIVNDDDQYTNYMIENTKSNIIRFSINNNNSLYYGHSIEKYREKSLLGVKFILNYDNFNYKVKLLSPGKFSVYNGLCAIAISSVIGITINNIIDALSDSSVEGRFEVVNCKKEYSIIIDYSHNGISLFNALTTLREYNPNHLICLFGSVGGRTKGRRKELAEVSCKFADLSIITSDNPDFEPSQEIVNDIASYFTENSNYLCICDRKEAIHKAIDLCQPGDILILAGKGHENYQLINGIKEPFSEKEIVLNYLKN